jgi:glucokinase
MSTKKKLYAGIDLGGTTMGCALGTAEGEIIAQKVIPTHSHEGPEAIINRIAKTVNALADEIGQKPAALGMGVPGLANLEKGVVKFLPNLPTNWREVPVRALLSPQIGCPVYLLNDVRAAALGELKFGCGRENPNVSMVFLTLGTGIGGGIVLDGKLRLGHYGAAGELGHMNVEPNGPPCGCGSRGCMETYAAGPAIAAQGVWLLRAGRAPKLYEIVRGNPGKVTPKEMAEAALAGDEEVRVAIERAATYLGIGVSHVINTLSPDMIVFGGGVAEMGDLLFDTVRATIRERVRMFPVDHIRVIKTELGDRAGTLGTIALAAAGGLVA